MKSNPLDKAVTSKAKPMAMTTALTLCAVSVFLFEGGVKPNSDSFLCEAA